MRWVAMFLVFVVGCRFDLPEGDIGCPDNYVPLGIGSAEHVYLRAPQNSNWTGPRDFCASSSTRTYLAVPNDANELADLVTVAGTTPFWVGIDDRAVEGTYMQVSGGPATFLPWALGQPDNAGGDQDCVVATATEISDENCAGIATRSAVCECEP